LKKKAKINVVRKFGILEFEKNDFFYNNNDFILMIKIMVLLKQTIR